MSNPSALLAQKGFEIDLFIQGGNEYTSKESRPPIDTAISWYPENKAILFSLGFNFVRKLSNRVHLLSGLEVTRSTYRDEMSRSLFERYHGNGSMGGPAVPFPVTISETTLTNISIGLSAEYTLIEKSNHSVALGSGINFRTIDFIKVVKRWPYPGYDEDTFFSEVNTEYPLNPGIRLYFSYQLNFEESIGIKIEPHILCFNSKWSSSQSDYAINPYWQYAFRFTVKI